MVLRLTGQPRFPESTIAGAQDDRRRAQRLARHLRPDEPVEAAVLQPRGCERAGADHVPYEDLGLNRDRLHAAGTRSTASCISAAHHLAGPAAQRQGRPRGHELLGRDALPVPRRGRCSTSSPRCTRAGSCAACGTSTCCGRWPSAGCREAIAWRRKAMFRAPFDSFHLTGRCRRSSTSCSARSRWRRRATSTPQAVTHWRRAASEACGRRLKRTSIEMGLVGVMATQLWHHYVRRLGRAAAKWPRQAA